MAGTLPKHLGVTLDSLMEDSTITSWSVHGNSAITTLTIRFKMVDSTAEVRDSVNVTNFKRVSSSQIARDSARAKGWRERSPECADSVDDEPHKQVSNTDTKTNNMDPPAVPAAPIFTPTANHKQCHGGVSTRSQCKLTATAKPYQPSPLPQVDGPGDKAQADDSTNMDPPWAGAFIAAFDHKVARILGQLDDCMDDG